MKQKMFTRSILLALIFLTTNVQLSQADNLSEFKIAVERYNESMAHWDIEQIAVIEAGSVGFSDFARHLQNHRTIDPKLRCRGLNRVISQYEYYDINIVTLQAEVIGNTGIAAGCFNIIRKHKEFPEVSARKRWSSTWIKKNGKWELIFYHRELIDSHW